MDNVLTGQIERRCDFCPSRRLRAALPLHQLRTGKTQLYTRKGVNGVVDAAVVWNVTAGHTTVGGVHNGITLEGRNIPLPEIKTGLKGHEIGNIRDALGGGFDR